MGGEFPGPHAELLEMMQRLQTHYRDMCDIEFTIEQGRLFMLQTRIGKRTAAAALRMAADMQPESLIDTRDSALRIQPAQLDQLPHPHLDPKATYTPPPKRLHPPPRRLLPNPLPHLQGAPGPRPRHAPRSPGPARPHPRPGRRVPPPRRALHPEPPHPRPRPPPLRRRRNRSLPPRAHVPR